MPFAGTHFPPGTARTAVCAPGIRLTSQVKKNTMKKPNKDRGAE